MKTLKHLNGEDRRIALEGICRSVAQVVAKKNYSPVASAHIVAKAMLEGVSMLDGALGPVVLLRAAWTDVELAEELEALAAEYRQQHADHEAAEAEWRQLHVNSVSDPIPVSAAHSCEPKQIPDHDNPRSLSLGQTPIVPPNQVDEND